MAGSVEARGTSMDWRSVVARYQTPSIRSALTQILNTLIPFAILLVLMVLVLDVSYWLVLLLALPAAELMVRVFIIMHDCGHGSFLPSRRWNDIVGFITGVLTLTPYAQWRHDHAIHHATSGNLEGRGWGDITTLSVTEYLALTWRQRLAYRLYRHPLVMLGFGPFWLQIRQRWPTLGEKTGWQQVKSVLMTDAAILVVLSALALLGGLAEAALVYLPVVAFSGAGGIFLFYVQHQFEEAYWRPREQWDYATAALQGSTHLVMPRTLRWFTGNIGLHHVHHLSPRIPNYRLQRCHDENVIFHSVPTLTLAQSLRTLGLRLWDEQAQRMIGFRALRRARRSPAAT